MIQIDGIRLYGLYGGYTVAIQYHVIIKLFTITL